MRTPTRIRRFPQVRAKVMTRDARDARDLGHALSRDLAPLGDRALVDAKFAGDLGAYALVGGVAQQVHAETYSHSATLSETKWPDKPQMVDAAYCLFRKTKLPPWHTWPMTIGARIRVARLELGLTQRYVAKALGVSPSAVNQWESDTTKPSITKRAELAVLLHLRLDELIPEAPVNEIADTITRIVRAVPPHKQAALVVAIEGLARLLDEPPPNTQATPPARVKQRL